MADDDNVTDNVTLWDNEGDREVSIITDGADERLAVDAKIAGDISILQFVPKFDFSSDGDSLTGLLEIKAVTAQGRIDFISISGSSSNYDFILNIDGVQVLRISMADMSTLGLTSSNATTLPIFTNTSGKNFILHPNVGLDFKTSFSIQLEDTGNPKPNINWLVKWRVA